MKKWMKKTGLVAAGVIALTSVISAVPVTADSSRVVYFTIQNNTICKDTAASESVSGSYGNTLIQLNLNNIGSTASSVIVHLYDNNGTSLNGLVGLNTGGYTSTFTPGDTPFTIDGKSTKGLVVNYGNGAMPCSSRPAFGKIEVVSDTGLLMANGEIEASTNFAPSDGGNYRIFYHDSSIVINQGNPF